MSKVILFDLDGTITDSAEGIIKSVQYALRHFGIEEPDLKKLECFVGPPLREQFIKYANFSEKQAEVAVAVYRERYAKIGIFENRLYEGIREVLQYLKSSGRILGVASSKPTVYVKQILEYFHLEQYFDVVVGAELDGSRSTKAEVLVEAIELLGKTNQRGDVLLVGDRSYDVEGAFQCGLQCVGAAYGYGGITELEMAGAIYIARTVEELRLLAEDAEAPPRKNIQTAADRSIGVQSPPVSIGKKIWRVIYPIGTHYGISFVVAQVVAMIITGWYIFYQGKSDINEISSYVMQYSLLMTGISSVIAIPILTWFYKKDCIAREKGMLGNQTQNRKHVSKGIYAATILLLVTASQILNDLITVSGLYDVFPAYKELDEQIFDNQPLLIIVLVVVIGAPIVEELVFRGLVFKRVQDYIGTGWGIFISAVIFGIYHGNMIQFIYAGLVGLCLSMVMARTNSLKTAILGHLAANLWSVIGVSVLSYLSFGNTYVYIGYLLIFAVIGVCSAVYIINKSKKKTA